MQKLISRVLPVILLSGAAAYAGSFTSDFSDPNATGYTLNQSQDTAGNSFPVVTNNALLLIPNEIIGQLSFVLDDLDNGAAIDSFNASFNLQMGPGSSTPADGFAFVFGPDVTSGVAFSEAGPDMPSGGVSVSFVSYQESTTGFPGIGVNVKVAGNGSDDSTGLVGFAPISSGTMVDSQIHKVSIQVNRNGTLDMVWNGNVIFTNLFLNGWTPVNGQFAFGGRNGGLTEQVIVSNLVINTTLEPSTPPGPIITSEPTAMTVNEGSNTTFSVGYDGEAPISFQWMENNQDIPDATGSSLLMTQVSYTNNGAQIVCVLTNPEGTTNTKAITLTVIQDKTSPTIQSVVADPSFTNLTVTYSKPVSDSALTLADYQLGGGVTVESATRLNQTTIALGTSQMPSDTTLTLTVNGVQDVAATPNTIAANTKVSFLTFTFLQGTILHKVYYNCGNNNISVPFSDPRYPNNPDRVDLATSWVWPPNGAGTYPADPNQSTFVDSLEGYFYPPQTGDYVFYTVGDDEWYLYMSTNSNPANMLLVAQETGGWGNYLNWDTAQGGTLANWNTAGFSGTAWPTGNTMTLTKGQPYYMILFHHDHTWSGGDQMAATFLVGPDATNTPSDGTPTTLTGSAVGFDFNPAGSSLTFNEQPQSVGLTEGAEATFSAAATGVSPYGTNVTFQWQILAPGTTNWVNIAGATSQTLSTPPLAVANSGTEYRVIASMATISSTSSAATVTVTADTTPPVLTAGAIMGANAGTVTIGVGFNKTIDDATGNLPASYSISSGTIIGFQWCTNRFTADSLNPAVEVRKQGAMLTVSNFTGGTVTVRGIADTFGNVLASTNIPVTVNSSMSWGVIGANQTGGWNGVVPVASNGFDLYSDGFANWAVYDEATYVYQPITGDFDKVLRVEYQDGSEEWARAGLSVRDVLNFGMDRAEQSGSTNSTAPYNGLAGRFQQCHVNPVGPTLTGPGTAGNASWEGNRRLDTGGPCDSSVTNVNAVPDYPNPWCRIQRQGQTFTIYRSPDGANWEKLGQTVWGLDDVTKTPMPATVYVGVEYSPENGNITLPIDQGTFLAQFRDYGDYQAVVTSPTLTVGPVVNGAFNLTYTGTLQSSTNVNGPYVAVPGAASPFSVNSQANGGSKTLFFRAAQ